MIVKTLSFLIQAFFIFTCIADTNMCISLLGIVILVEFLLQFMFQVFIAIYKCIWGGKNEVFKILNTEDTSPPPAECGGDHFYLLLDVHPIIFFPKVAFLHPLVWAGRQAVVPRAYHGGVSGQCIKKADVFFVRITLCLIPGKSKEAEIKRINKELANIRSKFKGECSCAIFPPSLPPSIYLPPPPPLSVCLSHTSTHCFSFLPLCRIHWLFHATDPYSSFVTQPGLLIVSHYFSFFLSSPTPSPAHKHAYL